MNAASDARKVAVITGASQGIGAGPVAGYRQAGYCVARSLPPSDEQNYSLSPPMARRANSAISSRCARRAASGVLI